MDESKKSDSKMKLSQALAWLVDFGAKNPANLRPGDLLNLLDEIRLYLETPVPGQIEKELRKAGENPSVLNEAVGVAKQIIETVADGKRVNIPYEHGEYLIDASGNRIATYEGSSLRD